MLYVTTRVSGDAFTAFRALSENRGPEGGFFVPMYMPSYSREEIARLANQPFSQNVAEILNLFFGTKLSGYDVELVIGRYPVRQVSLNGRLTVANAWNNPRQRFDRLVTGLEKAIRQSDQVNEVPSDWFMTASRIAILFALWGQLQQDKVITTYQKIDIAVPNGDFSALMAAWYARSMGLPIETIICCCTENNGIWNLFHKGTIRTDVPVLRTYTPACDYAVPADLERLIFALSSVEEARRFCDICRIGGTYEVEDALLERLREGIHVRVVGSKQVASVIPNLYKISGYVADPYTALSYGGLMDYRAVTGSGRHSLIISEESPLFSFEYVCRCMNIEPTELKLKLE